MLTKCQAAGLRYVHDVLTGDFVTIGVVLLCPDQQFLGSRITNDFRRAKGAFPELDAVHLRRVCVTIQEACERLRERAFDELPLDGGGDQLSAVVAQLVPREDAALQFSPTISGITSDPQRTLAELFERFVGREPDKRERLARSGEDVWKAFAARIEDQDLLKQLQTHLVRTDRFEWEFRHAWKNGVWNAVQPVSLDIPEPHDIRDKAAKWLGRISALRPRTANEEVHVSILVGMPAATAKAELHHAAHDGLDILREVRSEAQIVTESEAESLARKIALDLARHRAN
jgi:hypothetical protein